MLKNLVIAFLLLSATVTQSQTIALDPQVSPEFFEANQEITITYNVTGTFMQSWTEAWLWTWIPNTSDAPSNINPANSNTAGTNPAKFSKTIDGDQHYFSIVLTPTDFFGLPASSIETMGVLIKGNDWGDGQSSDYLIDVGTDFKVFFESPTGNFSFYNSGSEINVHARTSQQADISIYIDGILQASANDVLELIELHPVIEDMQMHEIKAVATNGIESDSVFHTYSISPTPENVPLPIGLRDGINYDETDNTRATLVLTAPNKDNVFVIGDFNNWSIDNNYLMKKDGDQFWLPIENLTAGQEYRFQYLVNGSLKIADPYTEKISSPFDDAQIIEENRYPGLIPYPNDITSEAISWLQTDKPSFDWQNNDFVAPDKNNLVIYELLIRDFTDERTFNALIEKLDYLESLGINAIELMPVMEFEGNISWGYNPAFMLSVDKFYGTENNLKTLIDEAHGRGMAVILDIVLNHAFGRCPLVRLDNDDLYGPPTDENVWLNRTAKHDFNVGYDFNHESLYTQDYADRVNEFWINEFKIDGFRFDLSKGFTQNNTIGNVGAWGNYDASRVALLKRMADQIWAIDPDSYVILEHFADNSEETILADYGMMLWGNMHSNYRTAGKGNPTSFQGAYHKGRGWDDPNLVAYMESHDEERIPFEIMQAQVFDVEQTLERLKLNAAFFFLIPGPKMIWQFGEMGYAEELNDDRLGIKPTHWEYLDDPSRVKLIDVYTSLINLKTKTDLIKSEFFTWDSGDYIKWININDPETKLVALGNFRRIPQSGAIPFPQTGTWHNYFSGKTLEVNSTHHDFDLEPGELRIYTSEPIENYVDGNPVLDFETEIETQEILTIEPNAVLDILTIKMPKGYSKLYFFNVEGRQVKEINVDPNTTSFDIDVTQLVTGYYFISADPGNETVTGKFLKYQ